MTKDHTKVTWETRSNIVNVDKEERAGTSTDNRSSRCNPYTITEEMLQERLKHKNTGRYITQLLIAISASLGALSFGIDLGWSSPATQFLINRTSLFNATEGQYTWISSLMPLGCSVGIVPWHYAITTIGPKRALIMQTPFYVLVFLVMISVKKTMKIFLAGRFFSGFLSIANIIGGECLVMDCVHKGNIGHLLVFFRSSVYLGVIIAYTVGYFMSRDLVMAVCAGIPIVNMILLAFLPESPVFLYNKSEIKAEKALTWYRGRANIYTEMRSLVKDAELRMITDSYKFMLYSKVVMRALFIVLGLIFFQVFSGYYAFIFYVQMLWEEFGTRIDPFIGITIFGIFLYFSNLFANMIHYHSNFSIRKPLLISTTLIAIVLTILAVCAFFTDNTLIEKENYEWVLFITLNTFVIAYETGLGVYADMLLFDYFPYQVQATAKIIAQMWLWLQVFFITKYFLTLKFFTSTFVTFCVLTVISYSSIIYCYFFIIETKGKNLLQIQLDIGGNPMGNRGAFRNRAAVSAVI